jgi:hypothetical protein
LAGRQKQREEGGGEEEGAAKTHEKDSGSFEKSSFK